MGGVAVAAVAWPFIDQMNPSSAALALSSVEVDLTPIQVGQGITVKWRGQPLFVRRRTADEIAKAKAVDVASLPDPLARNLNKPDNTPNGPPASTPASGKSAVTTPNDGSSSTSNPGNGRKP